MACAVMPYIAMAHTVVARIVMADGEMLRGQNRTPPPQKKTKKKSGGGANITFLIYLAQFRTLLKGFMKYGCIKRYSTWVDSRFFEVF